MIYPCGCEVERTQIILSVLSTCPILKWKYILETLEIMSGYSQYFSSYLHWALSFAFEDLPYMRISHMEYKYQVD